MLFAHAQLTLGAVAASATREAVQAELMMRRESVPEADSDVTASLDLVKREAFPSNPMEERALALESLFTGSDPRSTALVLQAIAAKEEHYSLQERSKSKVVLATQVLSTF